MHPSTMPLPVLDALLCDMLPLEPLDCVSAEVALWPLELLDFASEEGLVWLELELLDGAVDGALDGALDEPYCAIATIALSITTHNRNSVLFIGSPFSPRLLCPGTVCCDPWGGLRVRMPPDIAQVCPMVQAIESCWRRELLTRAAAVENFCPGLPTVSVRQLLNACAAGGVGFAFVRQSSMLKS